MDVATQEQGGKLPCNVHHVAQLELLPPDLLTTDFEDSASSSLVRRRPLRHVDDKGNEYTYALQPMSYSVFIILIVELLERFSFYGIYYTLTFYLTGVYDADWNAGYTSVDAASMVSISTAVAYTTPFVGAILADTVLGDYRTICVGAVMMYIPGLVLLTWTTVPPSSSTDTTTHDGSSNSFHHHMALSLALLFFWPMGTGMIKSVVNVFGAKQFHPVLQSSRIESYYVNFYTSINIGALAGITLLPTVAHKQNVTVACAIPTVMLVLGVAIFLWGTPRYVMGQPRGDLFQISNTTTASATKTTTTKTTAANATIPLTTILRIALLIVPFCIAYSQMPTTFMVQGTVMTKAFGTFDAASMNSLDALSVLVFGHVIGNHVYPALSRRGYKIPTTYKFALGSWLGALSILWALYVEFKIHHAHHSQNGKQINVLWQGPSYMLIGCGEIFAVSAAYEVAFTASAPQTKALASAVNIFCIGGIPNVLCMGLYQACRGWFRSRRTGTTDITHIQDYSTAHVAYYFWVLVGILLFGVLINMLPPVREYVDAVEQRAADLVKTSSTPRLTPRTRARLQGDNEVTPLLRTKRAAASGPALYKMGSMRAGPSLSHKHVVVVAAEPARVKAKYSSKLYQTTTTTTTSTVPPPAHHEDEDRNTQQGEQQVHNLDRHDTV